MVDTGKDRKKMIGKGGKSKLIKEEHKQLNQSLTFQYLKNSDKGLHVASEMSAKLEQAKQKEVDLADASLNIPVEELDVGITMPDAIEKAHKESMSQCRTLPIKNENRSWLQRAKIIYIQKLEEGYLQIQLHLLV